MKGVGVRGGGVRFGTMTAHNTKHHFYDIQCKFVLFFRAPKSTSHEECTRTMVNKGSYFHVLRTIVLEQIWN